MSEVLQAVTRRECPYLGLDFFSEDLGSWFFGREVECDRVITNLQAARLTLLHAESGTGKSSLLRAGVAWRLRGQLDRASALEGTPLDIPVVFSSWQDVPAEKLTRAIGQAIKPVLVGAPEPALPAGRLDAAIEAAAEATNAGLFIILDQFEEYLLYRAREPVPEQFADELARCVSRADLPANFLIAIREDAYASLGDLFKGRIGNVYGNYLHIDSLDRAAAERAIRVPLTVYNSQPWVTEPVGIQDELVTAVLDQVRIRDPNAPAGLDGEGRVATPLLQLVMQTIWQRDIAAGSPELRLATLQGLRGVENIVDTHLWEALRSLDDRGRETAIDVFDHLVTPSGGKIAEPVPDLARRTGHSEELVGSVLDKLDRARIVRPVPAPPGYDPRRFRRYEIFHDVLTPPINRAIAVRDERRRARRLRRLAALAGTLLALSVGIGIWIWALYQNSIAQQHAAKASQLAATAEADLTQDPEHSMQLAMQALGWGQSAAATHALRDALPAVQEVRALRDGTVALSAAFDPVNPDEVVSADKDGMVSIWDVKTGQRLRKWPAPAGVPRDDTAADAMFTPDGTRVAVGYGLGTIALFDAATGRELRSVNVGQVVNDIQFVGDTGELAIATQDGVYLWPTQSDRYDVLSSSQQANSIAVDPGNPLKFAVANSNGTVIWTLNTDLRLVQRRSVDSNPDNDVKFNPDGREVVIASSDGKVRIYDITSFRETMTFDADENDAMGAVFSPDETLIAAGYASGTVRVWDVATGLPLTTLTGNAAPVERVRFGASGSEVITAGDDGTIRVWLARPRELESVFPGALSDVSKPYLPLPVDSAEYSPDGGRILTVSTGLVSLSTSAGTPVYPQGQPLYIFPANGAGVNTARFNRAGTEIVTADTDGTVDLWHASGQNYAQIRLRTPIKVGSQANDAEFSPDGSRLVIVTSENTAQVRSARTGQLIWTLNPGHDFNLVVAVYSPDGRQIVTGDGNGQVEVWNAATGKEIRVLGTPGPYIGDVEFNRSGSEFASAANGTVTVWNARNDQPVGAPIDACPQPETVSFSPDGGKIVVACGNGHLLVFDVTSGQQLADIKATSAGSVYSAEFSPDGASILTAIGGEGSGDVRIWSAELATTSIQALERDAAASAADQGGASSPPSALSGTWNGSYVCQQGATGLSLVIQALPHGALTATFNFFPIPGNTSVPAGSFTMAGSYSRGRVSLTRRVWITQPFDYVMVNLTAGPPTQGGTVLSGDVIAPGVGGCTTFSVTKSASSGSG
jgi:WD40 repeat protein